MHFRISSARAAFLSLEADGVTINTRQISWCSRAHVCGAAGACAGGRWARLHFHWNRLIEDINPARAAVQHFLDMQSGRLETLVPGDAGRAAVRLLANLVQREALVMTYNDALMLIGGLFVAALFVMPLVRRPRATPVSPGE